jgi:predicted permease
MAARSLRPETRRQDNNHTPLMLSDLRYAVRQILRFPGYTLVVVLTLAFGIAVNTQIFSAVSGMFMQPMAVRDPGRLVVVIERSDQIPFPHQLSFLDFTDLRAGSKALTNHVAFTSLAAHVSSPGRTPERVWVDAVTPDIFGKLGVSTVLGRPLQPADGELPPGTPVAVLTHRYWKNHFGADPAVIGRPVLIDGKPFTVVGVASPGLESFAFSLSVAMFVPSGALPMLRADGDGPFKYRNAIMWRTLAYLPVGGTVAAANTELAVFAKRFVTDFPEEHRNARFQAVPEMHARPDPAMSDFAPVFSALFAGLVMLVLFIACANVANLMTARAVARESELVVRAALGASRARLVRQLLLEALLLAAIAGVVGATLAIYAGDALARLMPEAEIPIRREAGSIWQLLAFTTVISLAAGIGAGLFPALRASRIDLNDGLKKAGRQSIGGRHRMRDLLVVGQVAMSCVVLIASALFVRALNSAGHLNLGFRSERLLMASFDLTLQGYDEKRGLQFEQQLLERVRALPGVEDASFTQHVPFGYGLDQAFRQHWPENSTAALPDGHTAVMFSRVEPGFIKMFGVPLLRGRDLLPSDNEKAPQVAVINQAMADAFWPGKDPIGQHFHRDWAGSPVIEVVGVVATGKYMMLMEDPKPYYYTPIAQAYAMPGTLMVRTAGAPDRLAGDLRAILRTLDPNLPIYSLITFDEHMLRSGFALMPLRTGAMLAAVQGVIGLLLAIMGLYSVVSYDVNRRTREIGVRIALGATDVQVVKLVSRDGLRLTLQGLAVGLGLALLFSFALSRFLWGVKTADPVAFPIVVAVLVATAAIACWLPARRATRVDPVEALRAE